MIFRLNERLIFPDPALAEEDGLLAIDGDLSQKRLLLAYENGIFPWFNEDSPILWYSPPKRFVLFPKNVKISKSMKQVLKSNRFKVTRNHAFVKVIKACAEVKREGQEGTWIIPEMQEAYLQLHHSGYAHSVEVWEEERLVGGLYGVLVNQVFCGESMFSLKSNASKIALIWLCQNVTIRLIDCQIHSDHLERMGARLIPRLEFMKYLKTRVQC